MMLRLWKVPAFLIPIESNSLEMVLGDEKLEEGQVYEMPCFAVLPESGLYRTTLHPYKLAFQSKAKGVEASKETRILLAWLIVLRDVISIMTAIPAEREYVRDGKLPESSNDVLLKNLYLACDPYMRNLMNKPQGIPNPLSYTPQS
ncbi:NADP-dependent alkenal double bond reductase p1-like protein, partial [Trifolium pratense]